MICHFIDDYPGLLPQSDLHSVTYIDPLPALLQIHPMLTHLKH